VEKQTGSEWVRKLNQLRTNFEPALVSNQFFFQWKRGTHFYFQETTDPVAAEIKTHQTRHCFSNLLLSNFSKSVLIVASIVLFLATEKRLHQTLMAWHLTHSQSSLNIHTLHSLQIQSSSSLRWRRSVISMLLIKIRLKWCQFHLLA